MAEPGFRNDRLDTSQPLTITFIPAKQLEPPRPQSGPTTVVGGLTPPGPNVPFPVTPGVRPPLNVDPSRINWGALYIGVQKPAGPDFLLPGIGSNVISPTFSQLEYKTSLLSDIRNIANLQLSDFESIIQNTDGEIIKEAFARNSKPWLAENIVGISGTVVVCLTATAVPAFAPACFATASDLAISYSLSVSREFVNLHVERQHIGRTEGQSIIAGLKLLELAPSAKKIVGSGFMLVRNLDQLSKVEVIEHSSEILIQFGAVGSTLIEQENTKILTTWGKDLANKYYLIFKYAPR